MLRRYPRNIMTLYEIMQVTMAACDWSGDSGAEMLSCDWLEAGVTNGDQGEKIRLELLLLRGRESCFVAR